MGLRGRNTGIIFHYDGADATKENATAKWLRIILRTRMINVSTDDGDANDITHEDKMVAPVTLES